MTRLIILVSLSGERFSYTQGQEVEMEDVEAQQLLDAGYAKLVDAEEAKPKSQKSKEK